LRAKYIYFCRNVVHRKTGNNSQEILFSPASAYFFPNNQLNMMNKRPHLLTLFLLLGLSHILYAQLSMPAFFSDGMVLQRNSEIPLWGKAEAREQLTITFDSQTFKTRADREGNWQVSLPALAAGGPYLLNVTGKSGRLDFDNILIGDVFLCGGQSNMEWPLRRLPTAEKEAMTANYPQIRLIKIQHDQALQPQDDVLPTSWQECSPQTVMDFSAIAYFFARHLHREQGVPIGLISSNWGGTPVESWISAEKLAEYPQMQNILQMYQQEEMSLGKLRIQHAQNWEKYRLESYDNDPGTREAWYASSYDYTDWPTMELPAVWDQWALQSYDGSVWFKRNFELPAAWAGENLMLYLGAIEDEDKVWVNGELIGETTGSGVFRRYQIPANLLQSNNQITIRVADMGGPGGFHGSAGDFYLSPVLAQDQRLYLDGSWHYQKALSRQDMPTPMHHLPATLYNAMIAPLAPYALKGMIWYQGESNEARAKEYAGLFPDMIQQWREAWGAEVPFAFVQLANYRPPSERPGNSAWAELREAQAEALKLPNTAMAVITDAGEADNIHPANKQDVGKRLALGMRKIAYGEDLVFSGPTFASIRVEGGQAKVTFKNVGSGLLVKDKYGYLKGFTIAGEDREWHFAKAEISGPDEVTVYHPDVDKPVAVRYAWADNPDEANLYNVEGLPAAPFRTDDWPGVTDQNKFVYQ
jgi:sialate O-acetylesterase